MITMHEMKNVLFSEEQDQRSLLTAIGREGSHFDDALQALLFESDEPSLQRILAPFLRAKAVKNIRESETFAVWRKEFIRVHGQEALENFFTQQSRNSVYGTDECAKALAEMFDVSLQVTITSPEYSYAAHTAEEDRPFFHIYNQPGHHWYIYNGYPQDTLGDGNCLFNSFAQILRNNVLDVQYGASSVSTDTDPEDVLKELQGAEHDVVSEFFKHMKIYQTQDRLRADFENLPLLSVEELADKIIKLSKEELNDHLCALQFAVADETTKKSKNLSNDEKKIDPKLLEAKNKLIDSIQGMRNLENHLQETEVVKKVTELAAQLEEMIETAMEYGFPAYAVY